MKRLVQVTLIGLPLSTVLILILSKQGSLLEHISPKSLLYVSVTVVCILCFWNIVERYFGPGQSSRPVTISRPQWLTITLFLIAFGLPAIVMAGVVSQPWWKAGDLLRDPLNVVQHRFARTGSLEDCCGSETGAISLLGNLFTMASAAVFGFVAIQRSQKVETVDGGVLLCLIGFSLAFVMALDDMFMLHESHQRKFVTFYATVLGSLVCLSVRWLSWPENRFLAATSLFFVGSIFVDTVLEHSLEYHLGEYRVVIEDGLKLFGMCGLLAYSIVAGLRLSSAGN